jgi:hypothetical protein
VGGGGKIDLQISDWKLSLFTLVGRNPTLSIFVDVVRSAPGAPRVNTINEKVLMAAIAAQGGLGFLESILKLEAAYYHNLEDICAERLRETEDVPPFTDAPKCFFMRRIPQARGTIGIERKLFTGLDAHVQFIAEFLHEDEIEDVPELVKQALPGFQKQNVFNPMFTLRLEGRWAGDDFRPSFFGFISLAEEEFFLNLDLEYVVADGLAVALGGFFFYGYSTIPNKNRYTFFGAVEDSTNVYVKVTAWF